MTTLLWTWARRRIRGTNHEVEHQHHLSTIASPAASDNGQEMAPLPPPPPPPLPAEEAPAQGGLQAWDGPLCAASFYWALQQ